MNKKRIHKISKILVMVLLSASIILNSIPSEVMGYFTHIIVGVSFIILTVLHIALSYRYFFACAKNFFRIKLKAKVNFILDIILIALCIVITVTGIMLAAKNIPQGTEYHDFEMIHGLLGAGLVFAVIAHGCLHIRRKRKKSTNKETGKNERTNKNS